MLSRVDGAGFGGKLSRWAGPIALTDKGSD